MKEMFKKFDSMLNNRFDGMNTGTAWYRSLETSDWNLVAESDDTLELISKAVYAGIFSEGMFVVHGWAAPYAGEDDHIRPSESPDRVRVRVFVYIKDSDFTVATRMGDDDLMVMDEPGEGAIIDTLREAIRYAHEQVFNSAEQKENT